MAKPVPSFPGAAWDGLSDNPDRKNLLGNTTPDYRDWDRAVSELMAIQSALLAGTVLNLKLPVVDVPSEDTPAAGTIRFDTSTGNIEVFDGADWLTYAPAS